VDEEGGPGSAASQGVLGQIARVVVQVHSRYYGRGPTKAKAVWQDQVVCVVLEDLFTPGEKVLIDGGKFDHVRESRQAFQDQIEPVLRHAIEEITGRATRAFTSQVSTDNFGSEVFVLDDERAGPAPELQA
jgi:uncharacterized protein YbcI